MPAALQGLVFRIVKGSALTFAELDANFRKIRDFVNAQAQLFGVVLKTDGTLKDSAVTTASIQDGAVTLAKLATDAKFPAGSVVDFAGSSIPSGWLECNGQTVSRTTYATLYAAIGDTHGAGDGSTTFNLPDCRGRASVGVGTGSGLTERILGSKFGSETHLLTGDQSGTSEHNHDGWSGALKWFGSGSATGGIGGAAIGVQPSEGTFVTALSDAADAVEAHPNVQPSIVFKKIIKT